MFKRRFQTYLLDRLFLTSSEQLLVQSYILKKRTNVFHEFKISKRDTGVMASLQRILYLEHLRQINAALLLNMLLAAVIRRNSVYWKTFSCYIVYHFIEDLIIRCFLQLIKPLSANPTKWSNTLKQFVRNFPKNYLSVFDNFVILALTGLNDF